MPVILYWLTRYGIRKMNLGNISSFPAFLIDGVWLSAVHYDDSNQMSVSTRKIYFPCFSPPYRNENTSWSSAGTIGSNSQC